jgi:hypothetical protein
VLPVLITSHPLLDFVLHMVIITLQQVIAEKISLLKELINPNNRLEVNSTYQIQIDAIKSIDDYDIEKVESVINQKKDLLRNGKDIQETDRLLAEIDALEWLQAQMVVLTLGIGNNNDPTTAIGT